MEYFRGHTVGAVLACVLAMTTGVSADEVTWVADSDGNWGDATKWSSNPVLPGATDNVIINVAGSRTITHSAGTDTIQQLTCDEILLITGGWLTVTGTASFGGAGLDLTASNATGQFTANTGPANVDDMDLSATSGGKLNLQGASGYTTTQSAVSSVRTVKADGTNSLVDLSNATSVNFNSSAINAFTDIKALAGGKVDLSSAATVTNSSGGIFNFGRGIRISADGTSSVVDLSNMTSFTNNQDPRGAFSSISATGGGQILTPKVTAFNNIETVTINGASSSIDTGMLQTFSQGTLTLSNGATTNLDNLVNLDGGGLIVNDGVTLNVNAVTSIANTGPSFLTTTYRANGTSSTLNMNGLTSYTSSSAQAADTTIEALAGGTVSMTALATLTAPGGLINADRPIAVRADGDSSVVNMTALDVFKDIASVTNSSLVATHNGIVNLKSSGSTQLVNVDVTVSTGGKVAGDVIELVSQDMIDSAGVFDETVLMGTGVVDASVLSTSGVVAPGLSAGELTIKGDYTQGYNARFEVEIFGTVAGGFDVLTVVGEADLAGELLVTLDSGYTAQAGDTFVILTADKGVSGGFDVENLPTLGGGLMMFVDINPDDVTLHVAVPEPVTLLLVGAGALGLPGCIRRKRRNQ